VRLLIDPAEGELWAILTVGIDLAKNRVAVHRVGEASQAGSVRPPGRRAKVREPAVPRID